VRGHQLVGLRRHPRVVALEFAGRDAVVDLAKLVLLEHALLGGGIAAQDGLHVLHGAQHFRHFVFAMALDAGVQPAVRDVAGHPDHLPYRLQQAAGGEPCQQRGDDQRAAGQQDQLRPRLLVGRQGGGIGRVVALLLAGDRLGKAALPKAQRGDRMVVQERHRFGHLVPGGQFHHFGVQRQGGRARARDLGQYRFFVLAGGQPCQCLGSLDVVFASLGDVPVMLLHARRVGFEGDIAHGDDDAVAFVDHCVEVLGLGLVLQDDGVQLRLDGAQAGQRNCGQRGQEQQHRAKPPGQAGTDAKILEPVDHGVPPRNVWLRMEWRRCATDAGGD